MTSRSADLDHAGANESILSTDVAKRPGLFSSLILAAGCGLVADMLEVGTIVVRKTAFDANHLYGMSRHFVWLVPVANVCVFLALGSLGWIASLAWPFRGRWLAARGLCAVAPLPAVLIAFPRIYTLAWLSVTVGIATRLVPVLESNPRRFRRAVKISFPLAVAILLYLGGSIWVNDQIKRSRESARPMPAAGVVQRPFDRDGHGGGRPPEPLRLRATHEYNPC